MERSSNRLPPNLGAVANDWTAVQKCPASLIPIKYFTMKEFRLPMSVTDFDTFFGTEFAPFGGNDTQGTAGSVFTNTAQNGLTVAEDFLLCGVQINLTSDGRHYVANGGLVAPTDPTIAPCFDGCGVNGGILNARAVLNHAAALEGIANLMTAMSIRMFIRKWNLVLDESWFNVGLAPWPQSLLNSSSLTSIEQDVIDTNKQLGALDCNNKFIAQNIVTASNGTETCAPAPVVPVSYGVLDAPGAHGCHYYRFKTPLLLLRGMPIEIFTFPRESSLFLANAKNALTSMGADCPVGKFDDSGFLTSSCNSKPVAVVPSGKFSFGINLLGWSVSRGLVQVILNDMADSNALGGIYAGSPAIQPYISGSPKIARLAASPAQQGE